VNICVDLRPYFPSSSFLLWAVCCELWAGIFGALLWAISCVYPVK